MECLLQEAARDVPMADLGLGACPFKHTPCSDFVSHCGASPSAFENGFLSFDHGFLAPTTPAPGCLDPTDNGMMPSVKSPGSSTLRRLGPFWTVSPALGQARRPAGRGLAPGGHCPEHPGERLLATRPRSGVRGEDGPRGRLPPAGDPPALDGSEPAPGRGPRPFQSVYDLFLNNFQIRSSPSADAEYRLADLRVENLDVLVPSFGNEPERIFYMAFVEIHAIASAVIAEICAMERAMAEDTPESDRRIVRSLEGIEVHLRECIAAFKKIQPCPGRKTYATRPVGQDRGDFRRPPFDLRPGRDERDIDPAPVHDGCPAVS